MYKINDGDKFCVLVAATSPNVAHNLVESNFEGRLSLIPGAYLESCPALRYAAPPKVYEFDGQDVHIAPMCKKPLSSGHQNILVNQAVTDLRDSLNLMCVEYGSSVLYKEKSTTWLRYGELDTLKLVLDWRFPTCGRTDIAQTYTVYENIAGKVHECSGDNLAACIEQLKQLVNKRAVTDRYLFPYVGWVLRGNKNNLVYASCSVRPTVAGDTQVIEAKLWLYMLSGICRKGSIPYATT